MGLRSTGIRGREQEAGFLRHLSSHVGDVPLGATAPQILVLELQVDVGPGLREFVVVEILQAAGKEIAAAEEGHREVTEPTLRRVERRDADGPVRTRGARVQRADLVFLHHRRFVGVGDLVVAAVRADVAGGLAHLRLVPGAVGVAGILVPDHRAIFRGPPLLHRVDQIGGRAHLGTFPRLKFKREKSATLRARDEEVVASPRLIIDPERMVGRVRGARLPDKLHTDEVFCPVSRQPHRVCLGRFLARLLDDFPRLIDPDDALGGSRQVRARSRSGHEHRAVGHHHLRRPEVIAVVRLQRPEAFVRIDQRVEPLFRNLPFRRVGTHAIDQHDRHRRVSQPVARADDHARGLRDLHAG